MVERKQDSGGEASGNELQHADVARRRAAAKRLAESAAIDAQATVALVDAVGDTDEEVCNWASEALEQLGQPAAGLVDALQQRLNSPKADSAYWAATLLGRLGSAGAPAVAMLRDTLQKNPNPSVQERAVWALGQMGGAASDALPALQQIAAQDDSRLARLAQNACQAIRQE